MWAHGDEHKHQRKLITPAFTYVALELDLLNVESYDINSVSAVRGMENDVLECTDKVISLQLSPDYRA